MRKTKLMTVCLLFVMALFLPSAVFAAENIVTTDDGTTAFSSIQEAIDSITDNTTTTTITLMKDVTDGAGFKVPYNSNIIIDFGGHTYNVTEPLVGSTGTETNGCQLLKGSTVTLKNGIFTTSTAKILVQNYSSLTLKDITLDATKSAANTYVVSNNCGKTSIEGNTSITGNKVAFDVCWAPDAGDKYPEGAQVTVNSYGIITGDIEIGTWGTISESNKADVKSTLTIDAIRLKGSIKVTEDYLKDNITINTKYYSAFTTDVTEYLPDGFKCAKATPDMEYYDVVSIGKHKVTVADTKNGKIVVDKTEAEYGEKITVTVTPDSGYYLSTLEWSNSEELLGDSIVGSYFYLPFDGDIIVKGEFQKILQNTDIPESITNSEKVEEILIEKIEELAKTNPELAEAIENGSVEVEVKVITQTEVTDEKKDEIESEASKEVEGIKVAQYIEITFTIVNKETGDELGEISNLDEQVTFTVEIPEDLPEVEEGYTRVYYIIREHDGEIEILDATEKDGALEFSSDKFSTYAIAYKDVVKEEDKEDKKEEQENEKSEEVKTDNPATGDNIIVYVAILVVALIGIGSVVVIKKRNNMKK